MNFRVVGMLVGAVLIPVLGAYQAFYVGSNYDETEATLVSMTVDCYLERSQIEFKKAGSDQTFYFDCAAAAEVAQSNGYSAQEIKKHGRLMYSYVSPSNKAAKQVEYELWREGVSPENILQKRPIFISRDQSEQIMWSKKFIF